ncbi:helix-turn-helix domain-containing protein [Kitasatospora sp. NPDC057223]|uniref:helix-turn-helix domain-containing protein n=1 Tax=Kitasatospora sp. NPDC057223 TaxID=3346055 RepID=UPI003639FE4E
MSTTFQANFRRITAGQNITAITERTGLDPGSISRYRSGKRQPSLARLALIAEAYGISPAEFLKPLEDAA